MKRWVWAVVAVVVAVLIGGYAYSNHRITENQYNTEMSNGQAAIQAKQYTSAESHFENALKRKTNDSAAQRYLDQTQSFVSGKNAMTSRHFNAAKNYFTTVKNTKNTSGVLVTRSKSRLATLKIVIKNVKKYNKIYSEAVTQNKATEYEASNATLNQLFADSEFTKTYYKNIYTKARALQTANTKGITGEATSATTSSSSSSSSASSSSASLTSSEQSAANAYSGSNEYTVPKSQTQIDGQTITAAQINNARSTLSSIGVTPGQFSDQDIRSGLIAANKAGISFKSYAQKNYK
ncbi:hypothetical protein C5L31_000339 [Secundilactobacillus malefermentans]|uniref:Uncharacterized protein n=1 Tax=Secundilactobacillus malefermentans TaxID=176292 RepID=A0A4V3A3Q4_9LACO|nr:hypothetical protein [Secundilactobacillus malefermentans]KRM59558.1 lipoprotein [Secundilactobacillus malefermentans DSM 5705 = KCTC 3548]TDG75465.1 hypothetical protein C5L31_000339 [Secundilactobacillus malefermentans]